jgi:hypothetical protein
VIKTAEKKRKKTVDFISHPQRLFNVAILKGKQYGPILLSSRNYYWLLFYFIGIKENDKCHSVPWQLLQLVDMKGIFVDVYADSKRSPGQGWLKGSKNNKFNAGVWVRQLLVLN